MKMQRTKQILIGLILVLSIGLGNNSLMAQMNYFINSQGIPLNASATEAKQRLGNGEAYLGEIRAYPSNQNPSNWIKTDGRLLQINQYLALYGMLGNRFGGDNINTFAVPKINYIFSDTLNGRAILKMPNHVMDLIPESSHIVIEPDYIREYVINSKNDTLNINYVIHHVSYDSVILRLPKVGNDRYFHIIAMCADTLNKMFSADSNAIMYFPDTIYVLTSSGEEFRTNHMASNHGNSYFKLEPMTHFQLYYLSSKKRYYLARKQWYEFNY